MKVLVRVLNNDHVSLISFKLHLMTQIVTEVGNVSRQSPHQLLRAHSDHRTCQGSLGASQIFCPGACELSRRAVALKVFDIIK